MVCNLIRNFVLELLYQLHVEQAHGLLDEQ